jgi:hypothetical protein
MGAPFRTPAPPEGRRWWSFAILNGKANFCMREVAELTGGVVLDEIWRFGDESIPGS